MPKYRITTVETTTYAYWVEAENEQAAWELDLEGLHGKELDHEAETIAVEEVE